VPGATVSTGGMGGGAGFSSAGGWLEDFPVSF